MLTLDGSTLEGGGQLVRVALSISAICDVPVRITNIRANRAARTSTAPRRSQGGARDQDSHRVERNERHRDARGVRDAGGGGGLKESHLAALNWLADKCSADVEGGQVGSREVVFRPGKGKRRGVGAGVYERHADDAAETRKRSETGTGIGMEVVELKNPGSIWLVWQAIFPYVVFSMLDQGRGEDRVREESDPGPHPHPHPLDRDVDTSESEDVDSSQTSPTPPTSFPHSSEPAFRILLRGGTNVPKSPSSEYMQQVFLPLCAAIGLPRVQVNVLRRGWAGSAPEIGEVEISVYAPLTPQQSWPRSKREGGAEAPVDANAVDSPPPIVAEAETSADGRLKTNGNAAGRPLQLAPFHLHSRGDITHVTMTILAGSPPTHALLQEQLTSSLRAIPLFASQAPSIPITLHPSSSLSGDERRIYVLLVAHTSTGHRLGRDHLGSGRKMSTEADRRRVVAEVVGHVVRQFARECEKAGCVDEFAEDLLVIFQALAAGPSSVAWAAAGTGHADERGRWSGKRSADGASLHTQTVRWVCAEMLGTIFDAHGRCAGRRFGKDADEDSIDARLRAMEIKGAVKGREREDEVSQ